MGVALETWGQEKLHVGQAISKTKTKWILVTQILILGLSVSYGAWANSRFVDGF